MSKMNHKVSPFVLSFLFFLLLFLKEREREKREKIDVLKVTFLNSSVGKGYIIILGGRKLLYFKEKILPPPTHTPVT